MSRQSKKLYVSKSKIHRKGIFAKQNIKLGEIVGTIQGRKKYKVNRTMKDVLGNPDWVGFRKHFWINPQPPYKHLNHSCNPNVAIRGNITLTAIKNIKIGDEITIDYSIIEADPRWYMKCTCGHKKCRGIIKSIQHLPQRTLKKYLPFVSLNFQKLYGKIKVVR